MESKLNRTIVNNIKRLLEVGSSAYFGITQVQVDNQSFEVWDANIEAVEVDYIDVRKAVEELLAENVHFNVHYDIKYEQGEVNVWVSQRKAITSEEFGNLITTLQLNADHQALEFALLQGQIGG